MPAKRDQIYNDRDYFDEKFGAIEKQLSKMTDEAERANVRIDAYENKIWGLAVGMFGVGGAGGYTLPAFIKWLIGH